VKSGEQNLGEIRRIQKCRKIKDFRRKQFPVASPFGPPLALGKPHLPRSGRQSGKSDKTKGVLNEENQLQKQMRKKKGF
jgi:hypothetical protein